MTTASEFLETAYADLGLRDGALFDAVDRVQAEGISETDWINKGEWLAISKAVGIEKVFFVEDNPVVVFARCEQPDSEVVRHTLNKIWCMSRPQCLFLAQPGMLSVYDLTRPPIAEGESADGDNRLLRRVSSIAAVQSELADFRRELLESGAQPKGQQYYSAGEKRADKALIEDLKRVREELLKAGLNGDKAKYANALIGRSIFVRYLEDREILLRKDFQSLAEKRKEWVRTLDSPQGVPLDPAMGSICYTKVLANKDFTYALFDRIYRDFNGDLFPVTDGEREAVGQVHLTLLKRFLSGEIADDLPRLFFFAYRFNVVPIELISSIYEAFYNAEQGGDDNQGAHYTPIELVEYLLSRVLTADTLSRNPRVLDPACGSGIFLVESFRRIVRYRQFKCGRRLGLPELRKILREQIHGIDINGEAVKVAAFSLYLTLLHYLDPPDIWRDRKLPNLTYRRLPGTADANDYNALVAGNACALDEAVPDDDPREKFASASFDVVVGNPPWGYPKPSDTVGIAAAKRVMAWCEKQEPRLYVGDKELSQAFVHRTLDFLREDGVAGLLVSTGVFFKRHANSQTFRRQWLSAARLDHVVNFAAVRGQFFGHAIAPFASVVFVKACSVPESHLIQYWSAKNTLQAKRMNAVVLSRADHRWLKQDDAKSNDRLWKVFWWGSQHDLALVSALQAERTLGAELATGGSSREFFGRGFEEAGRTNLPDWLSEYRELPQNQFSRYGPIDESSLVEIPDRVYRRGMRELYSGLRLLVRQGIVQRAGKNGVIEARIDDARFCFRNTIHGVSLDRFAQWQAKILLAVFWSSLARYFFFLTCGSWGMWNHKLQVDDIRRLPIRFPEDKGLRQRIVKLVDRLRRTNVVPDDDMHASHDTSSPILRESEARKLELELDELIFDLYELSEFERDLIRDMCDVGLDLFYRHADSDAVKRVCLPDSFISGLARDLPRKVKGNDLVSYLRTLLRIWNQELESEGELAWRVIRPNHFSPMIAVILETVGLDSPPEHLPDSACDDWAGLLRKVDEASLHHDGSKRVFIDGMIRVVSDTEILVIKRNERRFWTASMAREDAEATILQAMQLQR